LQRTSTIPEFCGAMINGMTDNLFLDDDRFSALLAAAQRLAVPLYLHPSFPPPAVQTLYYGRLTSGIPGLQIIIGHMGETLRSQVFLTTSRFFTMPPLETAIAPISVPFTTITLGYPPQPRR